MNWNKLSYFIDEFWYNYRYGLAIIAIMALIIFGTVFVVIDMQRTTEDMKNLRISTQELIAEIELANEGMKMIHAMYNDEDIVMHDEYYNIAFRK